MQHRPRAIDNHYTDHTQEHKSSTWLEVIIQCVSAQKHTVSDEISAICL
jgi:hypothetical protein